MNDSVTILANYDAVSKIVYLGSMISSNGDCSENIKRILAIARTATTKFTKIWKDQDQTITKAVKLTL